MKKILNSMSVGIISVLALLVIQNCSSTKNGERDLRSEIKRDYEVREASVEMRPGWISNAEKWAADNKQDNKVYRFFAYETTPKMDRGVACDLAKTNVRADIASEVATFIEKSLGESRQGEASIDLNNPQLQSLREFVEVTLAEKTQALLHGTRIVETYWEKRQYLTSKGAKRDFIGFTCAVLVTMEHERLKRAVEEAANHVVKKADDPETKETVKKALQDVSENFVKAKQGLI